jgi:RNA polymerase sigma factor (sigma-70 family)
LAQPDLSSTDLDFIERHVHFFRLVEQLPEIQRRVVCERFVEERSIREIARRLRKTEGAIKQLQFRALQTLRAQIGDRDA